MIDGMDGERGAVTAGGRGYYMKVIITRKRFLSRNIVAVTFKKFQHSESKTSMNQ